MYNLSLKGVNSKNRFYLNTRTYWIAIEMPNLLIVIYYILTGSSGNLTNYILISPFVIHYINRTLIYPFRNPSEKRYAIR